MCVTPTPTRTPIGFCTDNDDCPVGQVCVDNHCVDADADADAARRSAICTGNEDCPDGQVCVRQHVRRPHADPQEEQGGGGGCNCEIDPGAARGAAAR